MIRESVRAVAQELMEAEICELIGAERSLDDVAAGRSAHRVRPGRHVVYTGGR